MSNGTSDERVAVVTGGSTGIGEAIARAFLERGTHVAIAARDDASFVTGANYRVDGGSVAAMNT